MAPSTAYVLITPCRDEAEYLPHTIASVAGQTIPPKKWVIVDDGSQDQTPAILERAAREHEFIEVVRCDPNRERSVGPGVVEAFYHGLSRIDVDDFAYLCKLDADLEFGPKYFQIVIERMISDPWIGTLSGKTYLRDQEGEREEHIGDENSHGAAKFFRRECFQDIGGFVPHVGWDAIDGHMCRMRGWKASSTSDPELRIIHLRRMGSSQRSFWEGRLRWGRGKYFIGSAWYYVLAAGMFRMFERPYLVSGTGIITGYLQAVIGRHERFDRSDVREEIRRFERRCLLKGKTRTLAEYAARIEQAYPERGPKHRAPSTVPA